MSEPKKKKLDKKAERQAMLKATNEMLEKTLQSKKEKKARNKKTKDVEKSSSQKSNYFKDAYQELKKVSWPSKKELFKYTIVTLVSIIILSAYFLLFHFIMATLKEII